MLHIHNGDCSANIAKQTKLPGEHFAWREALIDGPAPAGLSDAEWRSTRARHLSESYEVDFKQCAAELLAQEQKLETFVEHDEVVLWFEHDLFCQTNLLFLLDWFGKQKLGATKLSLICIGEYPGVENFHGLGELSPEQLESLFPDRQNVSARQLALAASAWQTYCSRDPRDIENLLQTDTSALPFLKAAFKAHLKRFPSTKNGLGQIENSSLQLVHAGFKSFLEIFPRFIETEPVYGLGDAQFSRALQRLSDAGQPLLTIEAAHNGNKPLISGNLGKVKMEITELGAAVMRGDGDFVSLNGIDQWFGGVYLSGERNLWRWDDEQKKLVFS